MMYMYLWMICLLVILGTGGCYRVGDPSEVFDSEDNGGGDGDTDGDGDVDTASDMETDAQTDTQVDIDTEQGTGDDPEDTDESWDSESDTESELDTETEIDTESFSDVDTSDFLVDVRPLTELNTHSGDAYPHLSPDGLRIYFTHGTGGIKNNLYMATREALTEPFGEKRLVSDNFAEGIRSCWLTNDELEIYFTTDDAFYTAVRETIDGSFSLPLIVELQGNFSDFISGPSLTPDKQELYLYAGSERILIFDQVTSLSYTMRETLAVPDGLWPSPGQLSKDGLHYYLGLAESETASSRLYRFDRDSIVDPFETLTKIGIEHEQSELSCSQPSVSADETEIAFMCSSADLWDFTDLYAGKQFGQFK